MKNLLKLFLSVLLVTVVIVSMVSCSDNKDNEDPDDGDKTECTHEYEWKVATTPLCETKGEEKYTCKLCGDVSETRELSPLGHKEQAVTGTPAACTVNGLTDGKKCETCGEFTEPQTPIPAIGHTYGADDSCTVCGVKNEAHEHIEVEITGFDATCTESGMTTGKKCSVCGDIIVAQTVINAKGHTEQTIPGTPATCTTSGISDGKKCSVCNKTLKEQEAVDALGHKPEEVLTAENFIVITESTCKKAGTYKYRCAHSADEHWIEVTDGASFENMSDEQKATVEKKAHIKVPTDGGEKCESCGAVWSKDIYRCSHTDCIIPHKSGFGTQCTYCGNIWFPSVPLKKDPE